LSKPKRRSSPFDALTRRPPRRWLLSSGLQGEAEFSLRRTTIIVARSLSRYTTFPAPLGARRVMPSLIRLRMEQASPFARTDGYAVADGERVALWYWDAQAVGEALSRAGEEAEAVQCVPEAALVPPQSGARLLALAEGYEGRFEDERGILGSVWWRNVPSLDDWQAFCRDQGLPPERQAELPIAQSPQLLDIPFAPNALAKGEFVRQWATERIAYAALATLVLVPAGFYGGQWASYAWQQHAQQRATAALKESAAPIVEARARVFADSDFIEAVGSTQQYLNPLELLAGVAQSLRVGGLTISEVDYKPGSFRMQMSNLPANFSVAEFVDRLSAAGVLDEVQATLDGMGSMTLTANVRKRSGSRSP
jgi:hypothetical protein